MGIYKSEIVNLRKNIGDNIGQRIIIKESPGKRSKPLEKSAIIDRVGSYNYTDLFTRQIEVKIDNGNGFEPLIEPQIEIKRRKTAV